MIAFLFISTIAVTLIAVTIDQILYSIQERSK
jgi:hypothetical protein